MNNFLVKQKLSKNRGSKNEKNDKSNSALIMPADFSPYRKQANIPQVMVIDVQPSSLNSTTPSSPCSSSQESAVVIPVDLSIESHQVPIIVADQDDLDQRVEASGNPNERFGLRNAFFVKEKAQEQALC